MTVDVPVILTVGFLLVLCGLWGVLRHRGNLLRLLPAAQLVFLGSLFNFSMGSALFHDASGLIFALFTACLTGLQTVATLAVFLLYFRKRDNAQEGGR